MKVTKTKDKKYPIIVILTNGVRLKVPNQSQFSNSWLRSHGCSIMAEYLALQYVNKHIWPVNLLRWHRKHDKEDVKAKVTVKGVCKGINHYKPDSATYHAEPTCHKIETALKNGEAVILEQKNPIHSIFLVRDNGVDYIINYGKIKRVNVEKIAKTATNNKTYRGMVCVRR